jgi:uncharacterized membrane protein
VGLAHGVRAVWQGGGMSVFAERDSSDDGEVGRNAAERLTFFSDAVIAIAITLLALELPVPKGQTNSLVLSHAWDMRDDYLAFVISFLVIAAHWRSHHRVFRYVTKLGNRLTGLTIAWLLFLVITPFATRMLTEDGAFETRFIFYAIVLALACLVFMLMIHRIGRDGLVRPDTPAQLLPNARARLAVQAGAFVISIPAAFLIGSWAYACWIVIPVAGGVILNRTHRHLPD